MTTDQAPRSKRLVLVTLAGIGAASAAAHIGNNFTTYRVGGLIGAVACVAGVAIIAPLAGRIDRAGIRVERLAEH